MLCSVASGGSAGTCKGDCFREADLSVVKIKIRLQTLA
jgi:hypothetical protein